MMRKHRIKAIDKLQGSVLLTRAEMRTLRLQRPDMWRARQAGLSIHVSRGRVLHMHAGLNLRTTIRIAELLEAMDQTYLGMSNLELAS